MPPPPVFLTWQIMRRLHVNMSAKTKAIAQSGQQEHKGLTRSSYFRRDGEIYRRHERLTDLRWRWRGFLSVCEHAWLSL